MAGAPSTRPASRAAAVLVPVLLVAAVAFATYVVVGRICIDYLRPDHPRLATGLLVGFFVLLVLMAACYVRTLAVIATSPAVVPRGPGYVAPQKPSRGRKRRRASSYDSDSLEAQPYRGPVTHMEHPDPDPDSPGLELFYTKDAFVCDRDGRPKWCSRCCAWKPDRAHHSSEIDRCVRRMDHYCPWVGGIIDENSFKFFVQFNVYAAMYCLYTLGIVCHALQSQTSEGRSLDRFFIAVIVLGGFFGLFTSLMAAVSLRYVVMNLTNIDALDKKKVYQLAVYIPTSTDRQPQRPAAQRQPPADNAVDVLGAPQPAAQPTGAAPEAAAPAVANGGLVSTGYQTITYPLPLPDDSADRSTAQPASERTPLSTSRPRSALTPREQALAARDAIAFRTFAILSTSPSANPWNVGFIRNWQAVMGRSPLSWVLPLHMSPCVTDARDFQHAFYPMGDVLTQLRQRHGLAVPSPPSTASRGTDEKRRFGFL